MLCSTPKSLKLRPISQDRFQHCEKAKGDLTDATNSLLGRYREDRARLFPAMHSSRTGASGHEPKQGKSQSDIRKNAFPQGWWDTGTGSSGRLCSLHPWRRPWATCTKLALLWEGAGPDGLQLSLPTYIFLWFCDTDLKSLHWNWGTCLHVLKNWVQGLSNDKASHCLNYTEMRAEEVGSSSKLGWHAVLAVTWQRFSGKLYLKHQICCIKIPKI